MRLSEYLKKHGLEQADLVKRTGISKAAMSRYVNRTRIPPADVAERIIKATSGEVTLSDLVSLRPASAST